MAEARSTLTLFTEALDHLKSALDCLKLVDRQGWPHANTSGTQPEAESRAARNVAAKATEAAREALLLCTRIERPSNKRNN